MHRVPRRALAIAATAAFATLGVTLGAGAAVAGSPGNSCSADADYTQFATDGAFWSYVCPQSGDVSEAGTPHKNDPFDGMGSITIAGLPVNVPAGNESTVTAGSTTTITYSDVDVDSGGGDLVDIQVVREFSGSFARWTVSVFDADDQSPRSDVPLTFTGNFGSDSDTQHSVVGDVITTYGDPGDPIVIIDVDAPSFSVGTPSDGLTVDFTSAVATVTIGLVDYGCTPADMDAALVYAEGIAGTFPFPFGQTLVVPGSEFCSTVPSTIYLTPGQPFTVTIPVTYTATMDFGPNGGQIYAWQAPIWVTDVTSNLQNVPGSTPTLTISGIAPASGSAFFSFNTEIYDGEDEYVAVAGNWLTLVAGSDPLLAETGIDASPLVAAGGVLALLGTALLVRSRRRIQQA